MISSSYKILQRYLMILHVPFSSLQANGPWLSIDRFVLRERPPSEPHVRLRPALWSSLWNSPTDRCAAALGLTVIAPVGNDASFTTTTNLYEDRHSINQALFSEHSIILFFIQLIYLATQAPEFTKY